MPLDPKLSAQALLLRDIFGRELHGADQLRLHVDLFERDLAHTLDSHASLELLSAQLVVQLDHRGRASDFGVYLRPLPEARNYRLRIFKDFIEGERPPAAGSPYPGLLAFSQADADRFFGRETEVDELLGRIESRRWLSVEGPSGVGKSSLVHAGLLAGLPGAWVILTLRPGTHPWDSLCDAAWQALPAATRPPRAGFHLDVQSFRDFVFERSRAGAPLLLLVDQLEEAFTFADAGQAADFAAAIARALSERALNFRLVTTIRSDQVGALVDRLPALGTLLNQAWVARYVVAPMEAGALLRAIVDPAERHGRPLEPGLDQRICDDALSRPGESPGGSLPLVAHLLHELWQRCENSSSLTHAAYTALGGVAGALTSSADQVLDAIKLSSPSAVQRVRRLLLELATVDSSGRATRRELPLRTARELLGDDAALLDLLSSGKTSAAAPLMRLIVVRGHGPAACVDLIHERLLTGWPTLHHWLADVAEGKRIREELREAARQWDRNGRDPDALPNGKQLDRFETAEPDSTDPETQRAYQDALTEKRRRLLGAEKWQRRKTLLRVCGFAAGIVLGILWILRGWEIQQIRDDNAQAMAAAHQQNGALAEDLARAERRYVATTLELDAAKQPTRRLQDDIVALNIQVDQLQHTIAAHRPGCATPLNRIVRAPGTVQRADVSTLVDCWHHAHAERTRLAEFLQTEPGSRLRALVRAVLAPLPRYPEFAFLFRGGRTTTSTRGTTVRVPTRPPARTPTSPAA